MHPPHSVVGFPVHHYVLGISVCHVGIFPSVGGLRVFPISWGFWGHISTCDVHMLILVNFCSALCLTFLLQLQLLLLQLRWLSSGLSSVAPSLTGFPVSLDQHGVVQPPPLMQRGSGGVIGSVSVPQQQTPSSMPLLAYANYVMGSPQVGFFLRVEPPTTLYIICLVCILVSAFYL